MKTTQRKWLCNFIAWLNKTYKPLGQLDTTLLIKYFEFQFSRWSGIKTPYGKNIIMLSWVIGPKAIKAWEQRDLSRHYVVKWQINKDFHLQLRRAFVSDNKIDVANRQHTMVLTPIYEEPAKLRFYNRNEGYIYCAQMTTLYSESSPACAGCKFKVICQERLQLTYPKLFEIRQHE